MQICLNASFFVLLKCLLRLWTFGIWRCAICHEQPLV
uniref:Uncharacterized protein n=1 Tax=Arundo donax TaxID=35708 RepID=A0A0A9SW61_ARUDO